MQQEVGGDAHLLAVGDRSLAGGHVEIEAEMRKIWPKSIEKMKKNENTTKMTSIEAQLDANLVYTRGEGSAESLGHLLVQPLAQTKAMKRREERRDRADEQCMRTRDRDA